MISCRGSITDDDHEEYSCDDHHEGSSVIREKKRRKKDKLEDHYADARHNVDMRYYPLDISIIVIMINMIIMKIDDSSHDHKRNENDEEECLTD